MKFNRGIAAMHVEVHRRLFDVALVPRLDGVAQADLVGIPALDVHVAHAQPHVHEPAGGELAGIAVRLFIVPIDWLANDEAALNETGNQTHQNCFEERKSDRQETLQA